MPALLIAGWLVRPAPAQPPGLPNPEAGVPGYFAGEPEGSLARRLQAGPGFLLAAGGEPPEQVMARLTCSVEPGEASGPAFSRRVSWVDPATGLEVAFAERWWPQHRVLVRQGTLKNWGNKPVADVRILRSARWRFRALTEGERFHCEDLKYSQEQWYGSTFWAGPGWTRVGRNWHHPEADLASARVFTAPRDGRVHITGRVLKADTNGGDGVRAFIRHNGEALWQAEIEAADKTGVAHDLARDVRAGDRIRFVVDRRGTIACDTTTWDPLIAYEGGPQFLASEGFSDQQGTGGWAYQMESDKVSAAGEFRLYAPGADLRVMSRALPAGKTVVLRGGKPGEADALLPFLVIPSEGGEGGVLAATGAAGCELQAAAGGSLDLALADAGAEREVTLAPGASVALPIAALGAYTGGWEQGAAALRRFLAEAAADPAVAPLADRVRAQARQASAGGSADGLRQMLSHANVFFPPSLLACSLPPLPPLAGAGWAELDAHLQGLVGSGLDPAGFARLAGPARRQLDRFLEVYEQVRPFISQGYCRPLPLPADGTAWDARQLQSAGGERGLLLVYRAGSQVAEQAIRWKDLRSDAVFRVHDAFGTDSTVRSGAALMAEGLPFALPPRGSRMLLYEAVPGATDFRGPAPAPPSRLSVKPEGQGALRLSWPAVRGVAAYVVSRDGVPVTRVEGATTYRDAGLEPGRVCRYDVAAERDFARSAAIRASGTAGPAGAALRMERPELGLWALVEADWRAQDGIVATPESYREGTGKALAQGKALLADLRKGRPAPFLQAERRELARLASRHAGLAGRAEASLDDWRALYLRVRWLKRQVAFANPLFHFGKLLFAKAAPPAYSHLVMQYFGWQARPGGGLFILERPGYSLATHEALPNALLSGSVLAPCLSWDARRVLFSYSRCAPDDPYYHVYEANVDGSGLRQLTRGEYEDLMPAYLPDGGIVFTSTRRKGYARCFGGQFGERWHVYTLHRMGGDGRNVRTLSYHETNEWFPTVLPDGHILYSRWDYVDRHAVLHQNLWVTRPDGTNPVALWGNHTESPHCSFEAQPVPGSGKILFTASAHHSVTGGSIALLDPNREADGQRPITRLTPEVCFPEAEGQPATYYASPWPLSERYFLAAYSLKPLIFEPAPNEANALGLYLVDAFGNRELLYRDPRLGCRNPIPLRARPVPPALPSTLPRKAPDEGTMALMDVYQGLRDVPRGTVKALRIVQVLPKATPVADAPRVGLAGQEPTKAVLGTVPVEADGSAFFTAPARKPFLVQALDVQGMAVQTMRSITYLQPGERTSCIGCHESRRTAPPRADTVAARRPPSRITPGPDGCKPFSYPRLVQPVLDRHCVGCHGEQGPAAGVALTGTPHGGFSRSYWSLCGGPTFYQDGTTLENAARYLVPRYGGWNPVHASEAGGAFGARGSRLMKMLLAGHQGVKLGPEDIERLAIWIDANSLFYGTYLPADQARQQRGDAVAMPDLQ